MSGGNGISRRSVLKMALGGTGALALGGGAWAGEKDPYGPFRMGIQSYSLRGFSVEDALARTQELGLRYWEAFQGHVPPVTDQAQIAAQRERLKKAGVRLMAWGVQGFGADAVQARHTFEFARALGVRVISADPAPQALEYLEKLVEEFQISIAIHNHGPGSRYDKIQQVMDAVKDRHPRIGACVDTGHFLRSREDPVEAIRKLGKRVYGVHLKDVKGGTQFTEIGKGDLDVVGCLRALKALNYRECLALEYEEHPQMPIPYIQECLEAVRAAVARLS